MKEKTERFICFHLQKFDQEPHYALLKELFTQVCSL